MIKERETDVSQIGQRTLVLSEASTGGGGPSWSAAEGDDGSSSCCCCCCCCFPSHVSKCELMRSLEKPRLHTGQLTKLLPEDDGGGGGGGQGRFGARRKNPSRDDGATLFEPAEDELPLRDMTGSWGGSGQWLLHVVRLPEQQRRGRGPRKEANITKCLSVAFFQRGTTPTSRRCRVCSPRCNAMRAVLALLLLLCVRTSIASRPPPDVIVVVFDDLGFGDLRCVVRGIPGPTTRQRCGC